jgi:hypothetical protein
MNTDITSDRCYSGKNAYRDTQSKRNLLYSSWWRYEQIHCSLQRTEEFPSNVHCIKHTYLSSYSFCKILSASGILEGVLLKSQHICAFGTGSAPSLQHIFVQIYNYNPESGLHTHLCLLGGQCASHTANWAACFQINWLRFKGIYISVSRVCCNWKSSKIQSNLR